MDKELRKAAEDSLEAFAFFCFCHEYWLFDSGTRRDMTKSLQLKSKRLAAMLKVQVKQFAELISKVSPKVNAKTKKSVSSQTELKQFVKTERVRLLQNDARKVKTAWDLVRDITDFLKSPTYWEPRYRDALLEIYNMSQSSTLMYLNRWNIIDQQKCQDHVREFVIRGLKSPETQRVLWDCLGRQLLVPLWLSDRDKFKAKIPPDLFCAIPVLFELARDDSSENRNDTLSWYDEACRRRDHGNISLWFLEHIREQPQGKELLGDELDCLRDAIKLRLDEDKNIIQEREQRLSFPSVAGSLTYIDATELLVGVVIKLYRGLSQGRCETLIKPFDVAAVPGVQVLSTPILLTQPATTPVKDEAPAIQATTTNLADARPGDVAADVMTLRDFVDFKYRGGLNTVRKMLIDKIYQRMCARGIVPAEPGQRPSRGVSPKPVRYKRTDLEIVSENIEELS